MYSIGDKIMYGASGVMTVIDIRDEAIGDISHSYYVLRPTLARTDSFTFVPVNNERLVAMMRPLLSKEDINVLLSAAKDIPSVDWVPENRARQEYYKKLIESGELASMIAMIHRVIDCGRLREAEGKKNFLSDENAKAKAERLITSEIAVVLEIPEDEAKAMLLAAI